MLVVFKYYYNTPTYIFVVLFVFRKIQNSFIVSWTSTYRDYDIAKFRLRVSVEYISLVELYIFSKIE
jgi:hypothetical protein